MLSFDRLSKTYADGTRALRGLGFALAPGVVVTDMAKSNFPKYALDEHIHATPAGRLGRPGDLLGAVSFLCSPDSDYVVGQVLTVDGGYTMI